MGVSRIRYFCFASLWMLLLGQNFHGLAQSPCQITLTLASHEDFSSRADDLARLRLEIDSNHASGNTAIALALEANFKERVGELHQILIPKHSPTLLGLEELQLFIANRARQNQAIYSQQIDAQKAQKETRRSRENDGIWEYRMIDTVMAHEGLAINSLAFDSDSKRLFLAGAKGRVSLVDLEGSPDSWIAKPINVDNPHGVNEIFSIVLSPDKTRLFISSSSRIASALWLKGKLAGVAIPLPMPSDHGGFWLRSMSVSPDCSQLYIAGTDGRACVGMLSNDLSSWSTNTISTSSAHNYNMINATAMNHKGTQLFLAGNRARLSLVELKADTSSLVAQQIDISPTHQQSSDDLSSLSFSPNDDRLFLASRKGASVIDLVGDPRSWIAQPINTQETHGFNELKSIAVSPDGRLLFLAGQGGRASVVELTGNPSSWVPRPLDISKAHGTLQINSMALSSDGSRLFLGGAAGGVSVWNVKVLLEQVGIFTEEVP